MPTRAEPFFLEAGPGRAGQRFCIHHPPQRGPLRGAVLYVHPFAEEMNKSRRMAALGCRALAAQGFAVLQIDLLGCGDSSGDFGDASWDDWLQDVQLGLQWLRARHAAPLWLWGLRAGALLAAEAGRRFAPDANMLLWQPAPQGRLVLQQFLRLKAAADLAAGGKGVVESLKQALQDGRSVDVAGYRLPPALAVPLAACELVPPTSDVRVIWLETSTRPEPELLPASRTLLQRWAGETVVAEAAPGPAFWQTTEIEDAPALIEATLRLLCEEALV